jgi:hypothetical protein
MLAIIAKNANKLKDAPSITKFTFQEIKKLYKSLMNNSVEEDSALA